MVKKGLTPRRVGSRRSAEKSRPIPWGWGARDEAEVRCNRRRRVDQNSCGCDSGNLGARPLQADPMHAPRVEQPVVHDLPLVPASCLEIQQCRPRVLQLYKELQRISTGRSAGIDGLRLDPLVPLPDNQTPRSFLLHRLRQTRKKTARRRSFCCSPGGAANQATRTPPPADHDTKPLDAI